MSNNNIKYEYLYLNDIQKNINNNTLIYKLDNNIKCITKGSQKWFINMELIPFYINKEIILYNNKYEKIYILINELTQSDNQKYHFICEKNKSLNGIILKPLNLYNFNYNNICLVVPKLTLSFYKFNNTINDLEKIDISNINILPLELIIKYN